MLIKKQIFNSVLIALFLIITGCTEDQIIEVKLDSALSTHFKLIQDGKTGSVRVRLRQFMDRNGESSQSLFLMGLSYHKEKRYSKSVEWFEKSVKTEKNVYPPVWHFLGWSYYYLGNSQKSKECFDKYIKLSPNEPDSLFALGLIAMDVGDFAMSESLLNESISYAVDNAVIQAKAKARLADLAAESGNWKQAITLYEEAINQNEDLYEAWYRLSKVLLRMQKTDEAEKAFQEFQLSRRRVRPELDQTTRFPE